MRNKANGNTNTLKFKSALSCLEDSKEQVIIKGRGDILRVKDKISHEQNLSSYPKLPNTKHYPHGKICETLVAQTKPDMKLRSSLIKLDDDYDNVLFVYDYKDEYEAVKSYEISQKDYMTLEDMALVNDQIVNFYLQYMLEEQKKSKTSLKLLTFNSFFYPILIRGEDYDIESPLKSYSLKNIFNWKKGINKFEYDAWIVPVNTDSHWSLLLVLYPSRLENLYQAYLNKEAISDQSKLPCIAYLNSLKSKLTPSIPLIKYVYLEFIKMKKKENCFIDFSQFLLSTYKSFYLINPTVSTNLI